MVEFTLKDPEIKDPEKIEELSLQTILNEAKEFERFNAFSEEQQKVVQRMIHSSTCFGEIINNISFSIDSVKHIQVLIKDGASIVVDTNMINAGLSKIYTEKFNNNVICYVADHDVKDISVNEGITRTSAAVKKALKQLNNAHVILACGNAPTFLYSAIETLVKEHWDLKNVVILAMPVGFVNVEESKEYTLEFLKAKNAEGVVLNGRYGGSALVVSCLHSIYKLIG